MTSHIIRARAGTRHSIGYSDVGDKAAPLSVSHKPGGSITPSLVDKSCALIQSGLVPSGWHPVIRSPGE